MAAGITKQSIMKKLTALNIPFKSKTERYRFKVWFEDETHYTYFFLVWEAFNPWHQPQLITEVYTPPESPKKKDSG